MPLQDANPTPSFGGFGLIRDKKLSPVELTAAFLDNIERLDGTLQAYITVLSDHAMAEAKQAEAEIQRGEYRGPMHGIPIALKDLYDTAGVRTTASSRVTADRGRQERQERPTWVSRAAVISCLDSSIKFGQELRGASDTILPVSRGR